MSKSEKLEKDREGRFICPQCRKPMTSISRTFCEIDQWKRNPKTKKYEKLPTDSKDQCMCDRCGKAINFDICENLSNQEDS